MNAASALVSIDSLINGCPAMKLSITAMVRSIKNVAFGKNRMAQLAEK